MVSLSLTEQCVTCDPSISTKETLKQSIEKAVKYNKKVHQSCSINVEYEIIYPYENQ
jgi:hypothetical protein